MRREEIPAVRARVEAALGQVLDAAGGPAVLREAMAWSLMAGGKRLRPLLVLAARDVFPGAADAMPAACALEMIHTYSLVHDDLPALDDDVLRRGRATCHVMFGEALAILAGDALLTEAFRVVGLAAARDPGAPWGRVTAELAAASGPDGMVGGQVLDLDGVSRAVTREEVEARDARKTGALIRVAVRCGAILGGADDAALGRLSRAAEAAGRAFQVSDDLLDATGTPEEVGKPTGRDAAMGRTTWPTLLGVEAARRHARDLVASALADLDPFGPGADALRALLGGMADRIA